MITDRHQRLALLEHLDSLVAAKPETGEQWAEICRIEALLYGNPAESMQCPQS